MYSVAEIKSIGRTFDCVLEIKVNINRWLTPRLEIQTTPINGWRYKRFNLELKLSNKRPRIH